MFMKSWAILESNGPTICFKHNIISGGCNCKCNNIFWCVSECKCHLVHRHFIYTLAHHGVLSVGGVWILLAH
jgi:hypothetical protein